MNDETALRALMQMTIANEAKLVMLRETLSTLIARIAAEYEDPENFVMTLTAPASEMAQGFDEGDAASRRIARALDEFATALETSALDRLR